MLNSCGSSEVIQSLSAEERFELGKKMFSEGEYFEAINAFEIVKIQFPASSVADDAQYYLAECRFQRGEYILAAEEYQTLKRSMPASELVPDAQYKIALCYYNLSPDFVLDQAYTKRAIDEFQAFIEYYPTHVLASEANAKIQELNARLAQKEFETAQLYMKLEYYKSATVYFTSVIEKYHDTQYAEPAHAGLIRALVQRKKYDEAKVEVDKFYERYPKSELLPQVKSMKQEIESHNKKESSAHSLQQSSQTIH